MHIDPQVPVFAPADILLPAGGIDLTKWAVVACDQFTSQPEYWERVEKTVGQAPSTLHLILPEAQLHQRSLEAHIKAINDTMYRYLDQGMFQTLPGAMVYLERTQSDGSVRHGLVGMVDLEQYDFTSGASSLIRATERTVLERIPPRVHIRRDAPIELPHVLLLIDDPKETVIEPLTAAASTMEPLYDFSLMEGGGQLRGWQLKPEQMNAVAAALSALASPEEMERKYGMPDAAPLLFAVGDGNHSLAAAKACYEEAKKGVPESQWAELPCRYALVEVVNCHDSAIQFHPIHRVLFGVEPQKVLDAFRQAYPDAYEGQGEGQTIRYICAGGSGCLTVPHPVSQLAVGTLQSFLDQYLERHKGEVDYVHGSRVSDELGVRPGNLAFELPAIGKEELFRIILTDGVLPRKAFSMGSASDKRYYMEARRIR